jgi:hypothetical protein
MSESDDHKAEISLPDVQTVKVLLNVLLDERQIRMAALDALDTKAGIFLGFSGVLAAYSATLTVPWEQLILVFTALVSAVSTVTVLRLRKVPLLNIKETVQKYWNSDPAQVERTLLATITTCQENLEDLIKSKAIGLSIGMWALGAGILAVAVFAANAGGFYG